MSDKNILDQIFDNAVEEFDSIESNIIFPFFIVLFGSIVGWIISLFSGFEYEGIFFGISFAILVLLLFSIQKLEAPLAKMKVVIRILKQINYEMEQSKKRKMPKVQ